MAKRKIVKSNKSRSLEVIPSGYKAFITNLKNKIRSSQLKASILVNRELILLYWEIGKAVVERQEKDGWGAKVIERAVRDLQNEFPGVEGFSRTNIGRMRAFYRAYLIYPRPVGKLEDLPIFRIPWGHNIVIFESIRGLAERLWYANMTIEEGWSRDELKGSIKRNWFKRYGKAVTNFKDRLPDPHSQLAQETTKDPYCFDFIELREAHVEKELENGLLNHIEKFMREMGRGFAFVGRQVHFEINGKDFYVDLLLYNFEARCFYVVELKATDFKPEYVGKMSFYLSAVDDKLKRETDNPTIGLLICKTKDDFIVEYTLREIKKPIGVAGYEIKIVESLPKQLQGKIPTVAEIEAELKTLEFFQKKQNKQKKKGIK